LKDDTKTLKDLGLANGSKVMLVGSTITDVMAAATVPTPTPTEKAQGGILCSFFMITVGS
jgi:hypothetical protein